jgi:hypothetical protein
VCIPCYNVFSSFYVRSASPVTESGERGCEEDVSMRGEEEEEEEESGMRDED